MLAENWSTLLLISFVVVAVADGLLASWTPFYYKNKPIGQLSHSQLRIKQGTANFEHRLNVFAQSLVFCFVTLRIYCISLLVWLALSGLYYFLSFRK